MNSQGYNIHILNYFNLLSFDTINKSLITTNTINNSSYQRSLTVVEILHIMYVKQNILIN